MTQRLYEEDAYCRRFTGTVLRCTPVGERFAVVLDRTAFFPEGGGQAADTGTLDGVAVTDVQSDGDTVIHQTASPLPVGQTVSGEIDWQQRFGRMQNHTGEHIVSGLIHREYGLDNAGFHLGSEDVTLDVSGELTRPQLDHIEDLANAAVAADLPVTAAYPSAKELETLAYRSKKALSGPVRIVTVAGIDACACCAPHVSSTGQIGVIKLLDAIRYKGGMRIHLHCGRDALLDYRMRYQQTAATAAMLSVKHTEVADAVARLLEQKDQLSRQLRQERRRWALAQAQAVSPTGRPVCLILEPLESDVVRELATVLTARCGGLCAVFAGADGQGYQYAAAGGENLPALGARLKQELGGGGGGSAQMIQGRVTADAAAIRDFFDAIS